MQVPESYARQTNETNFFCHATENFQPKKTGSNFLLRSFIKKISEQPFTKFCFSIIEILQNIIKAGANNTIKFSKWIFSKISPCHNAEVNKKNVEKEVEETFEEYLIKINLQDNPKIDPRTPHSLVSHSHPSELLPPNYQISPRTVEPESNTPLNDLPFTPPNPSPYTPPKTAGNICRTNSLTNAVVSGLDKIRKHTSLSSLQEDINNDDNTDDDDDELGNSLASSIPSNTSDTTAEKKPETTKSKFSQKDLIKKGSPKDYFYEKIGSAKTWIHQKMNDDKSDSPDSLWS